MPTSSIDTFFACSLIVAVAIVATAFMAGSMQNQINGMKDLNQQDYLRNIADHIVTSLGDPVNWGSATQTPTSFGLSTNNTDHLYELDADKITRLSNLNEYSLSYPEVFNAAKLNNVAIGISVSQILNLNIELTGNSTKGNLTEYNFQISVKQDTGPVSASFHGYLVSNNFINTVSNISSSSGIGQLTVDIPNSFNEPSTFVVFTRATFDDRLTAFAVFSFEDQSENSQTNQSFTSLSPLNSTLNIIANYPNATIENAYAFTYDCQSNLNLNSNNTCKIPSFVDESPIVIVVQGTNGTIQFNEWTTYPQVPLTFGADFSHSETNVFVYPVTINGVLYKLTLLFGGPLH